MLNIATMGILKGNDNPETPGGGKRPPKGEYVKYIHIPYGGYVQYVQSALGDIRNKGNVVTSQLRGVLLFR